MFQQSCILLPHYLLYLCTIGYIQKRNPCFHFSAN
jgi:hypothetical protein